MKVLIGDEWKEFKVEFGTKMPEEIGGVEITPSESLEGAMWRTLKREVLCWSVTHIDNSNDCLMVSFVNDDLDEDFCGYIAHMTTAETLTYTSRLG